jgi:hypothetical protein
MREAGSHLSFLEGTTLLMLARSLPVQYLAHRALPAYSQHTSTVQRTLSNGHEAPIEEQVCCHACAIKGYGAGAVLLGGMLC